MKEPLEDLDQMGAHSFPPVALPPDIPHRDFFLEIFAQQDRPSRTKRPRGTIPPTDEWRIPSGLADWAWKCFFLAARAMVARHTPDLLELWDLRAAQFEWEEVNWSDEDEVHREELLFQSEALKDLLTIMVRPEAAKLGLKGIPLVPLFDRAKAAFAHCRTLRQRHPRVAVYEPMGRIRGMSLFPCETYPTKPLRTDSVAFYRLAMNQVFGNGEQSINERYLMDWFSADMIKDHVLAKCLPHWKQPAQAALALLAGLTKNSPEYLAQVISARRKSNRAIF